MDISLYCQGRQENTSCSCYSDIAAPKSGSQLSPHCVDLPGTWQRLMPLEACGLHLWLTGLAVVLPQCF